MKNKNDLAQWQKADLPDLRARGCRGGVCGPGVIGSAVLGSGSSCEGATFVNRLIGLGVRWSRCFQSVHTDSCVHGRHGEPVVRLMRRGRARPSGVVLRLLYSGRAAGRRGRDRRRRHLLLSRTARNTARPIPTLSLIGSPRFWRYLVLLVVTHRAHLEISTGSDRCILDSFCCWASFMCPWYVVFSLGRFHGVDTVTAY